MSTLAGATAFAAPAAMQVSLSISPNKTLPGLSVPLNLRIRGGASAVELAASIRVRATSPAGETFMARWGATEWGELELGLILDEEEEDDEKQPAFVIAPKSTVELGVPAVSFTSDSWAHDARFIATPGTWTIEALLYDGDGATHVSSPATLEIQMPAPSDLWIWQAIQRNEVWSIADRILAEQPQSPYFPYVSTLIRRYSIPEKIAIIGRAIELHPDSPVVPNLHYGLALYYGMEADRVFFEESDLEKAVALADKGEAELDWMRKSKDPWARLTAKTKVGDYPNRAGYLDIQRLQREKGTRKPSKNP